MKTKKTTEYTETAPMKGYKGMSENMTCRDFGFEIGKIYSIPDNIPVEVCSNGFHFCDDVLTTFNFYIPDTHSRFFEIEAWGDVQCEGNKEGQRKYAARYIRIVREITDEVYSNHAQLREGLHKYKIGGCIFGLGAAVTKDDIAVILNDNKYSTDTFFSFASLGKVAAYKASGSSHDGMESVLSVFKKMDTDGMLSAGCDALIEKYNLKAAIFKIIIADGEVSADKLKECLKNTTGFNDASDMSISHRGPASYNVIKFMQFWNALPAAYRKKFEIAITREEREQDPIWCDHFDYLRKTYS